ncbi:MAG: aminopeptidase [Actinomycetota bacterium]|nr:aminopeptidase [Actinomycetota bacterium]
MADLAAAKERYAEAIVRSCLHVRAGDLLVVRAEPPHRELVVALAEAAYGAGARLVEPVWTDKRVIAARVRHAREEDLGAMPRWSALRDPAFLAETTASVRIAGETDAHAFDGLPPDRLARELSEQPAEYRRAMRLSMAGGKRATVACWPTPEWSAQVYPGAPDGVERLLADILSFCRLGSDDPPGTQGWDEHVARIGERATALTAARLVRLELRAPGTALDLRLAPGVRWLGGPRETTFGYPMTPNFPTEENHTSPISTATEGAFRCTRPLAFRGRLIDGIAGEFRNGRLVRLEAAGDDDRDFLAAALDIDAGGRRLGEVALVDSSSRIGRTGRVYFNTLLDENATAHIAFGAAYGQTRPAETGRRGLNRSRIHLDLMIGSDELEATGIAENGRRLPLIVDGAWQLP